MSGAARALLTLAGAGALLLALWMFASGGLALPTRHPPVALRFSGLALGLLAAAPALAGGLLLALASGRLTRDAPAARAWTGAAIAAAAGALLLAPRY